MHIALLQPQRQITFGTVHIINRRQGRRGDGHAPVLFVVEDDASTLALLCDIAEDSGWIARGFTRLRDMRARLRSERPTLVILDDDLPDGSGGELARAMRDDEKMDGIPTVVCTAAHPMRQAEIGAWAPVISKPFDLGEIERFLSSTLRQRTARPGHPAAG